MVYLIVLLATFFAAAGQIFLKMGTIGSYGLWGLVNIKTAAGFFFYIIGALLWLVSLSKLPLKVVYPFTALTFVLVYTGSVFLFGESVGKFEFIGVSFIFIGLFIIFFGNI